MPDEPSTYERIVKALEAGAKATSPLNFFSAKDIAGFLPGAGIVQSAEDFPQGTEYARQARGAFAAGNYGDAAMAMGNSMLATGRGIFNAASDFIPGMAALPPIKGGPIRAFHGSPHDFDKFDLSKIGTGEGAQAYGHGLYFAENEGVAKNYRDTLGWQSQMKDPEGVAQYWIATNNGDKAKALADLQEKAKNWQHVPDVARMYEDAAKLMPTIEQRPSPGRMYEVQINADPEHFLDWDKPLSEQHPVVQEKLGRALDERYGKGFTKEYAAQGNDFRDITQNFDDLGPDGLSNLMRDQGIPGIKYLDAGSRGKGDGSRNYVVFDDKLITILKKYGWVPGMAIPAAAMQEYQQGEAPKT